MQKSISIVVSGIRLQFVSLFVLCILLAEAHASGTVFGSTDSMLCYEESQRSAGADSLLPCNKAIDSGQLNRRDLAATYSNRGVIHSKLGFQDRALKDHEKAVEMLPDMSAAYINRGNAYYRLGQYDEALKDYEKAISLQAGPVVMAYYNSGLTYLKISNPGEARKFFRKALELSPENTMIQSKLELTPGN